MAPGIQLLHFPSPKMWLWIFYAPAQGLLALLPQYLTNTGLLALDLSWSHSTMCQHSFAGPDVSRTPAWCSSTSQNLVFFLCSQKQKSSFSTLEPTKTNGLTWFSSKKTIQSSFSTLRPPKTIGVHRFSNTNTKQS